MLGRLDRRRRRRTRLRLRRGFRRRLLLLDGRPDHGGHFLVADGLGEVQRRVAVSVLELGVGAGLGDQVADGLGAAG